MRAMKRGLHVYGQKPLTQTIYEARRLTEVAAEKKLVTQMGIQIHSHPRAQAGRATDPGRRDRQGEGGPHLERQGLGRHQARSPTGSTRCPTGFNWDLWLGVAAERPFIGGGYYHPGNWRKRLDFGTGTFGDMGCHILDPVFGALGVGNPLSIRSELPGPNDDNWSLDVQVKYVFPGTKYTTETGDPDWYNGKALPPEEIVRSIGRRQARRSGVDLHRHRGRAVLAVHRHTPVLLPAEKFKDYKMPEVQGRRPLPAVRRGGPRQRQDLRAVQLLRPADRNGPARLPGDAVREDRT